MGYIARFPFLNRVPYFSCSVMKHCLLPILPVNQVLHNRAGKIWNSIKEGKSGDIDTYNRLQLINTNYNKYATRPFPSSMDLAFGPDPPPLYTRGPNNRVQNENNQILRDIRNVIRDKYLTANPLDPTGIG